MKIADIIQSPSQHELRRHVTMGPCLLLAEAAESKRIGANNQFLEAMEPCRAAFDSFESEVKVWHSILKDGRRNSVLALDCASQWLARYDLITGILGDSNIDLKDAIEAVVKSLANDWKYQPIEATLHREQRQNELSWRPSFFPLVDAELPMPNANIEQLLTDVARHHGYCHPGVLLAGEIIAEVLGCRKRPELTVSTKIMFAGSREGILATIRFERVPDGCGLLIPDPYRCGNLHLNRNFSDTLQRAWNAAQDFTNTHFGATNERSNPSPFDWRWRVELLEATEKSLQKPLQEKLNGNSGGVAIACALIASHPANPDNDGNIDPLDPNVGATAALGRPSQNGDWTIDGVGEVKIKTLVGRVEAERLHEVVISNNQNKTELPDPGTDNRFEYSEADTLGKAYELMTWHPRITRNLNRHLVLDSSRHLSELCPRTEQQGEESGGYIEPKLVELLPPEKQPDGFREEWDIRSKDTPKRTLSESEFDELVTGTWNSISPAHRDNDVPANAKHWRSNRIRIFADSGLGKSMFILYCQKRIAESGTNRLTIRLGRTVSHESALNIDWSQDFEAVARNLSQVPGLAAACEQVQNDLRDRTAIDESTWESYFKWMLKKGRITFLIDALDQAEKAVTGLGTFLASQHVRRCPAILTGRFEALATRSQAFVDNSTWHTLRIEPFDYDRQKRFLGDQLAQKILLPKKKAGQENVDADWQTINDDEFRRLNWKDLLGIPLLLQMIKRLALTNEASSIGELFEIDRRYELYDRAINNLIKKGWATVSQEQRNRLIDQATVRKLLSKVAWFMVWRPAPQGSGNEAEHSFSNILEGQRLQDLRQAMAAGQELQKGDEIVRSLEQVDITTAYQILDRADGTGTAFRHRSFLEFFAAEYLMSDSDQVDPTTGVTSKKRIIPRELRNLLFEEIHNLLDSEGRLLGDEDRLSRWSDWQDTLRFALSYPDQAKRNELARELISFGNPWIVAQALIRDKVELDEGVEALARWLVHRDYPNSFNYRLAMIKCKTPAEQIKELAREEIRSGKVNTQQMQKRCFRESAYLNPLRELLGTKNFYESVSAESSLLQRMTELPSTGEDGASMGTWNFLESFISVDGGEFPFRRYHTDLADLPEDFARLEKFELADFPVTNVLYELFDPSHARSGDPDHFSVYGDDPVIHVNWFMALEFCDWLSALTGKPYRLPHEWEWEWACRWQGTQWGKFWWGDQMDNHRCWCLGSSEGKGVRSRGRALSMLSENDLFHPSVIAEKGRDANGGLVDLLGNVFEWCTNRYDFGDDNDSGKMRVIRGGPWNHPSAYCSSSYRRGLHPGTRVNAIGFRLCRSRKFA